MCQRVDGYEPDEIEITPEMIAAGVSVLVAACPEIWSEAPELACDVLRAMLAASTRFP